MPAPPGARRRALLVGVPIVVLSVAGIAAGALTPVLLRDDPLLLLVLESRNRYLLLAGPRVDVVPFVVVGVVRRFASDPFFYLAGRWFGDRAVGWVERQLGAGAHLERVETLFGRVAGLLVFLFPGALVCALAGSTGMRPRRFVVLNLLGSLLTVIVLRLVVDAAAGPLAAIIAFNDRNALRLTALFVAATAMWLVLQRRQGRSPFGGGLDELTGEADSGEVPDPGEEPDPDE